MEKKNHKESYEKSPENYSNKSKKNKIENENKSTRLKIDNVIKNQIRQKNIKNKSSLNKIINNIGNKNKSVSNAIQEDDSSQNSGVNSQQFQSSNNNQPTQYTKQFRDINIDKLNNNNKIKFSSPVDNKNKMKENFNVKAKINISGKIMNKIEKEKQENINAKNEMAQESFLTHNNSNNYKLNNYNLQNSKNNYHSYNENIYPSNNQSNYYYYKKDAILKKQQHQKNIFLTKRDKDKNRVKNISNSNYISKSKTSGGLVGSDSKNQKISISDDKDTIKENENYLSDENSNDYNNNKDNNDILVPASMSGNKSTKNLKEFTLEKIPTQKMNNSFTIEQNKEHVKMFIESNNVLDDKPNSEVILENIKLQKLKDDTIKKIKKNENEMKSISYGVYQHVINMYKEINADNKDINALTDSLQKYMRQNLIIQDDKESEKLYKTFKKSFFNYILCEIELNNVEKQIEKRKIGGKWELNQNFG